MSQTPLLELDLLKSLIAIAETGNFSAAAEVVHRTPSAISMQVKRMEELLGRPIFVREPRSVVLNEDGEMLLAHARRMLALNADTIAKFATPGIFGTVRLGAIDHAAERFLPGMLREFANSHPKVRVDVSIENTIPQRDALRRGELDIAIVTCTPGDSDFPNYEVLFRGKAGMGRAQVRHCRGTGPAASVSMGRRVHMAGKCTGGFSKTPTGLSGYFQKCTFSGPKSRNSCRPCNCTLATFCLRRGNCTFG